MQTETHPLLPQTKPYLLQRVLSLYIDRFLTKFISLVISSASHCLFLPLLALSLCNPSTAFHSPVWKGCGLNHRLMGYQQTPTRKKDLDFTPPPNVAFFSCQVVECYVHSVHFPAAHNCFSALTGAKNVPSKRRGVEEGPRRACEGARQAGEKRMT